MNTDQDLSQREAELNSKEDELNAREADLNEYEEIQRQALENQEEVLIQRQRDLEQRERLSQQEQQRCHVLSEQLAEQREQLSAREQQLEERRARQDERARQIEARQQELERLELERVAGYPALIAEYERQRAELLHAIGQARRDALEGTTTHRERLFAQTTEDLQRHEALLAQVSEEHRGRLDALHLEEQRLLTAHHQRLTESTTAHMNRLQQEHQERLATIQHRSDTLNAREQRLDEKETDLGECEQQLALKERNVETREGLLDQERERIDDIVRERWSAQIDAHRAALTTRDAHLNELRGDLERARREIINHQTLRYMLGDRDASEILAELRQLRDETQRLRDELSNRLSPHEVEDLRRQAELFAETARELNEEKHAHRELRLNFERQEYFVQDLAIANERAQRFQGLAETYKSSADMLSGHIEQLKGVFERDILRETRVQTLERAVLQRPSNMCQIEDEHQWLERLHDAMTEAQFDFPRRLLWSFHTALKTAEGSPLTVLAGVSGTGKSKLPELYGRFGGIPFLSVPVDPSWDSPQSLLGYFNAVDNQFDATEILCALVQSQCNDVSPDRAGLADAMMIILLDEMNLAHVELYFSDMLSKLEERRGKARVELNVGLGAGIAPLKLELGRNVLWLGTMNEDETTTSLSDKVIDRGNILHFPRPRTFARRHAGLLDGDIAPLLPRHTWESWTKPVRIFKDEELHEFKQMLETINTHMGTVGRALGHRVWQSVEHYMGNHPDVRLKLTALDAVEEGDSRDAERQQLREAMKIAFEDQIVLKVMPKLRGIDTSGAARLQCLEPIRNTLIADGLASGLSEDFDRAMSAGHGVFVWHTAEYLLREGDANA